MTSEEFLNVIEMTWFFIAYGQVVVAHQLDQVCSVDVSGEVSTVFNGNHWVPVAVQDEDRHGDGRQNRTHIYFGEHFYDFNHCPRTGGIALVSSEELSQARILSRTRKEVLKHRAGAPLLLECGNNRLDRIKGIPEWLVWRLSQACKGTLKHEGRGALRICGSEEDAHRSAFRDSPERRSIDVRSIHDRPHVIHALLKGWNPDRSIGQSRSSLVKGDDAGELAGPSQDAPREGQIPHQLDVRDEPRNEHNIGSSLATDLVSDVNIAAFGVTSPRRHRQIVALLEAAVKRKGNLDRSPGRVIAVGPAQPHYPG